MTDQKAMVIPSIPLAALDAVKDGNVKDVLRALIDAHHVRNGNAGKGDERFVTAKEMGAVSSQGGGEGSGSKKFDKSKNTLTAAQISRVINDLQAQVIESQLFKELGERINLIDKPNGIFDRLKTVEIVTRDEVIQRKTSEEVFLSSISVLGVRLGSSEAALQTETEARVNADNAMINTVTTQFASVNNSLSIVQDTVSNIANASSAQAQKITDVQVQSAQNTAAVQQEATARINANNDLYAKYSIKIDMNGYVSGYGLMSTANNSVPFSEFIVRADRFAIGSPTGPSGGTPKVPFVVKTSDSTLNGVFAPAGTYMSNAFIENGSIGNAKIGYAAIDTANIRDLAVDTLKIQNEAVTIPRFITSDSVLNGTGSYVVAISYTFNMPQAGRICAFWSAVQTYGTGIRDWKARMYINGAMVNICGGLSVNDTPNMVGGTSGVVSGNVTVSIEYYGQDAGVRLDRSRLVIIGAMR